MVRFSVNGKPVSVDVDLSTPLLWVIRENLGLTGTKYGCGMASAVRAPCTLMARPPRSCVAPVSRAEGKQVTTIEGLAAHVIHPLQQAWIDEDVPQCGLLTPHRCHPMRLSA